MSTPSAPRSRSRSRSNDGAVGRLRPAASGGGSDIPEAVAGYILDSFSKVIQSQPTTTRDSHSQTDECHTLDCTTSRRTACAGSHRPLALGLQHGQ